MLSGSLFVVFSASSSYCPPAEFIISEITMKYFRLTLDLYVDPRVSLPDDPLGTKPIHIHK